MPARSIPVKQLRAECEFFARDLTQLNGGTLPEGVAAARPGHAGNPAKDAHGWLVYYRTLIAEHARRTHRTNGTGDGGDVAGLAVLAERPLTRASAVPGPNGDQRSLTVYPKSFETLRHMAIRDAQLSYMLGMQREVFALADELPSTYGRLTGAILDEHRLLAWIAMHEGCGMPWEPEAAPPETLPEHILALRAVEIHQVRQLFEQCNHHQLHAARQLLEEVGGQNATSGPGAWSRFFVGAAQLLGTTERVLMRDRSLLSVLFHVQVRVDEQRRAQSAAETGEG
jgi:hypothetical protein